MFSVGHLARIVSWLALLACLTGSAAWGQAITAVDQQFATYHHALTGAADDLLAAPPTLAHVAEVKATAPASRQVDANANINERFSSALRRVQQLRPQLEPILREEGMPVDVTAVVLVESGGRPTAISPKGALGLWQLMPDTARRYGLTVSPEKDERLDQLKATRAAARYLRDLYAQFGDWRLAFAAYNAGEQAVLRAMTRSGTNDFQRLNGFLPNETRAYVPAVMTARPLFGGQTFTANTLRTARTAQVLYASARLDN